MNAPAHFAELSTFADAASLTYGSVDAVQVLRQTERRLRSAHADHLGSPYNLAGPCVPETLHGYLISNLGDPSAGSHHASEVCELERHAVRWLMDLWRADPDEHWAAIGASGTEANLWALYLAREALSGALVLHSADAHYSIPKAARILGMRSRVVDSCENGAIDLDALSDALHDLQPERVVLALTCGTAVKGAHDDIAGSLATLDALGYDRSRRYVHLDGALNAMVVPFLRDAPAAIRPTFSHAIDSISTSGHKMIGTPMPCGALVARRVDIDRVASPVAELRSRDTTLMGSRNGHAVLAMWARFARHGRAGFAGDAERCVALASSLAARMRHANVPVLLNPCSLTLVLPEPSEEIVRRYQLACNGGKAHAIVMPSVTTQLLDRFFADYVGWWNTQRVTLCEGTAPRVG